MTQVFRFDREARLQEIRRAAQMLGERPEVLAVVLFGSLARQGPRGATAMSDADILVLLADTPLPFEARLVDYRLPGFGGSRSFPTPGTRPWPWPAKGWAPSGPPSRRVSASSNGRGHGPGFERETKLF